MAVTGWTQQAVGGGTRTWSGKEATTISPSATGTYAGILTRNANDSLGSDFTFVTRLDSVTDSATLGVLVFCFQSSTQYYAVGRDTYSSGTVYLKKNSVDISSGTTLASASIARSTYPNNKKIKVVKSGNNIKVYVENSSGTFVERISYTDSSYSSGKIGFGYLANWTSNTEFKFTSITDDSVSRRVFIIS